MSNPINLSEVSKKLAHVGNQLTNKVEELVNPSYYIDEALFINSFTALTSLTGREPGEYLAIRCFEENGEPRVMQHVRVEKHAESALCGFVEKLLRQLSDLAKKYAEKAKFDKDSQKAEIAKVSAEIVALKDTFKLVYLTAYSLAATHIGTANRAVETMEAVLAQVKEKNKNIALHNAFHECYLFSKDVALKRLIDDENRLNAVYACEYFAGVLQFAFDDKNTMKNLNTLLLSFKSKIEPYAKQTNTKEVAENVLSRFAFLDPKKTVKKVDPVWRVSGGAAVPRPAAGASSSKPVAASASSSKPVAASASDAASGMGSDDDE